MKLPIDRRAALMAGAAAVAAAVAPVAAQPAQISGAITYSGGAPVPKGRLEVTLVDGSRHRVAATRSESDGASQTIAFSLSPPMSRAATPPLQVVARLERADGWLVARGSAPFEPGSPVSVTLNDVMY